MIKTVVFSIALVVQAAFSFTAFGQQAVFESVVGNPSTSLDGADSAPSKQGLENQDTTKEYDTWQGSSIGARIGLYENGFRVTKVLPHVDDSPLKAGDRIISVGPIESKKMLTFLKDLGKYMRETDPGIVVEIKIVRDEQEQTVDLKTYRREFVDIATLVERINGNSIIKNHLEKLERLGDLELMTDKMVNAVRKSNSPREAFEGINTVIDKLGISHSAFVPGSTYRQLRGTSGGEIGLALRRFNVDGSDGYYVIDKKPGTAIHQSKILLGDRLLFINGVAIESSRRLVLSGEEQRYEVFAIDAKQDETIRIEFQHQPGELISERVTARETLSLEKSINASAKVISANGKTFGYLRFWNLMSVRANSALRSQLKTAFADCDAIVLDLRGRGGIITTVLAIERTIKRLEKPVIAITDELTRSAKEILSLRIKKLDNVTVVGEKTAGAVTACGFYELPSGNVFMYPVMSAEALKRFTGGVIIEGDGVDADLPMNFCEAYCNGNDALLIFAIETASQKSSEAK